MFYYQFDHNGRLVELGPANSEYEAKLMFQNRYGYWPEDATQFNTYPQYPITTQQW